MTLAITVGILTLPAQAMSIVYDVNRTIGGGSVLGTITTDGTLGTLSTGNIIGYSLLLNDGTDSFTISTTTGGGVDRRGASQLSATSSELLFNFAAAELTEFVFFQSLGGSEVWRYTLESFGLGSGNEEIRHDGPLIIPAHSANAIQTRNTAIATAQVTVLSEPGGLAMLSLGFAALGLVCQRKQRKAAVL